MLTIDSYLDNWGFKQSYEICIQSWLAGFDLVIDIVKTPENFIEILVKYFSS